jgi:hypothetical protein
MSDGESVIPKAPDQVDIRNFLFNEENPESSEKPEVKTETSETTESPKAPTEASKDEVTETSTESEPEVKENKPLDRLDKHPRFRRMAAENKELRQRVEAIEAERRTQTPPAISPNADKVPPEYANLFGEDVNAYRSWQGMLQKTADERAKAMFEDLKNKELAVKQAEEVREQKAVDYALNEFDALYEETGIDFTDENNTVRNQVLDICAKGMLTPDGFPNVRGAYELYKQYHPTQTPELEEKKKVLSKTVNKTNSQAKEDTVMTPKRLKEIEKRGGLSYLWGLNKS